MPPVQEISWEDYEYAYYERGPGWYWSVYLIAGAFFIGAILLRNFLFAIFIVLATLTSVLYAKRRPDVVEFSVNRSGIRENKKYYPYGMLHSYWIDDTSREFPKLLLLSKKAFVPLIVIPLANTDSEAVRNIVSNYLPEKIQQEPISSKIMEYLGF